MRKEIIQAIIKPYMKSKAFQNKGMRFIKDMGLFQIEVEIQSQRYAEFNLQMQQNSD